MAIVTADRLFQACKDQDDEDWCAHDSFTVLGKPTWNNIRDDPVVKHLLCFTRASLVGEVAVMCPISRIKEL